MRASLQEKVDDSIQYLRTFEPESEPYYGCYSGGKDSDVVRILFDLSGVNYELHNNHTTVDAPETVYYIRDVMRAYGPKTRTTDADGCKVDIYGDKGFIHYPKYNMWQLIEKKGFPPTRLVRYCCEELKEHGGVGRVKVTGVRWEESYNRKNNQGLVTMIGNGKKLENTYGITI